MLFIVVFYFMVVLDPIRCEVTGIQPHVAPTSKLIDKQSSRSFEASNNESNDAKGLLIRDYEKSKGETNVSYSSSEISVPSDNTSEGSESKLLLKLDRQYTPKEIAEYIFVTDDEKGFVQGVAEMVEDGQIMISRDDVILFLEAVQKELMIFRAQTVKSETEP